MMKRYFLLLTVLSFSLLFEAKEVSYDEALMKASEFFAPASSSKKQVKALKNNLSLATTFKQIDETDKPAFYIINNGKNGFVIVSADDNAKTILGYSDKGAFDADKIPENVKFWLNYYAQQISYVAQNGISKPLYATATTYDPIAPLLGAIEHDQNEPYNNMCPLMIGYPTPTGCAATAAGQIMTKWKYPAKGKGSADYSYSFSYYDPNTGENGEDKIECKADFSQSTYDWKNIKDKYQGLKNYGYTEAQANAVALLLRDIGYASQMTYSLNGSGTSDQSVAKAFVDNFSYDKSLKRVVFNAFYTEKDPDTKEIIRSENVVWNLEEDMMDDLYADLKAGRPVFCAGTDDKGESGHGFVCDGIQSDGKLHINWGWDGVANGYYALTAFIPTKTGTGAGLGQYTNNISFLTNIKAENKTSNYALTVGLRNLSYITSFNRFNKSETNEYVLFKTTNTDGKNVVYAGYDCWNLGYTAINKIGFGYVLSKEDVPLYSKSATWLSASEERMYSKYLGLEVGQPLYLSLDIKPKISIPDLVQGVQNGVYDLQIAVQDQYAYGSFYPAYIWDRGKVKNKIAVGKDKVYIYPASEKNYSRSKTPTNLKATRKGDVYTVSWTGTSTRYIFLAWDDNDLTVEEVSSKSKTGLSAGKQWAVFACDRTSGSLISATSHIAYGGVLDNSVPEGDQPTDVENVDEDGITISTHHLTIEIKATASSAIKVYNVSGDILYSAQRTHASFRAPQAGVYLVQVGDKKHKVLVK